MVYTQPFIQSRTGHDLTGAATPVTWTGLAVTENTSGHGWSTIFVATGAGLVVLDTDEDRQGDTELAGLGVSVVANKTQALEYNILRGRYNRVQAVAPEPMAGRQYGQAVHVLVGK